MRAYLAKRPVLAFFFTALFILALVRTPLPEAAAQGGTPNFSVSDLVGHANSAPSSLQFGPDDKLYVADRFGQIYVYEIVRNGPDDYEVISTEVINSVANIPNHDDDGSLNLAGSLVGVRQVTGLLVAGTAANPVLYVSSSDPRINDPGDTLPLDTNSGIVSRITQVVPGSWAGSQHLDLLRGLPRNLENHSVNGMQISPDGNTLYLAIGGHTNMGAPSFNFGLQWEYAWSAAIAAIDLPALEALPTQIDAESGYGYKYNMPTLDDPSRPNVSPGVDVGDPWGGNSEYHGANQAIIQPGMPITLHAVGFRNAYDLVLREDGRMFTIDNGPNTGWGGEPGGEGPAGNCNNNVNNGGGTINDNLHYVRELIPGELYYGGHPNPLRANPDDIYNATLGEPVPFSAPPVPFSMANPVECDYRNPELGEDGSLEDWPYSTNGMAEYTATNFAGALQGAILAAGWDSTNIVRVSLAFDGNDNPTVTASDVLFTTGGAALDVIAQGDDDIFPGTIWVANLYSLGGADVIRIYEPGDFLTCNGGPNEDDDGDGYLNQDEIDNGSDKCSPASIPPDQDGDFVSNLNDPDDDNDGLLDLGDVFAIDAQNGQGTALPADYNFDFAEAGLIGSPFTGLMLDGTTNYRDMYDPGNMTVIGAAGVFTIDEVPNGDALGSLNSQAYAFQFGADTCDRCNPFVAYTAMSAPLQSVAGPVTTESMGFYIGNGDQANYLKVVVAGGTSGTGAVDVVLESGDVVQSSASYPDVNLLSAAIVELSLTVDPLALTAQPAYRLDGGVWQPAGGPLTIPASWLAAPDALAVGVISTAGASGAPFSATWTEIGIHAAPQSAAGSWTTLPGTVPDARHETAYVELNGLFYLLGGRGLLPVNIYDPASGVWTSGATPPVEMHHIQAVTYNGLIYVLGAMTGGYPDETPLTHVYIYDPHQDSWYQGLEIPANRRRGGGAVAVYNDKIYVAGGIQNGHISGTVGWLDSYDPVANTWTALPDDMPNPRDHTSGIVYGDKLYVVGGRITTQPDFAADTVAAVDVYDFTFGNWSTLANDLPTPRAGAMVALLGDEIVVIGGESDAINEAHAEAEALSMVDFTWRSLASLPSGQDRHASQAIVYGDQIYIASGSGAQGGNPELSNQVRFNLASCPVPVAATDSLNAAPGALAFGNVLIGNTGSQIVTISNPAGSSGAMTLLGAQIIGQDAAAFGVDLPSVMTLAPGESVALPIEFSPTAVAAYGAATIPADGAAALAVRHTGANNALTVPLTGNGVSSGGEVPISGLAISSNSPVTLGVAATFNASVSAGTNVSYSWDFGDGATASGANVSHTYGATGSYLVTVTATNPISSASATTTLVVQPAGTFALRLNSGGPAYTDGGGRVWAADNSFSGGATYGAGVAIANTVDDTLYQTERYGNYGYDLAVPQAGCYNVNLHFAEIWWGVAGGGGNGSRVFNVTVEGSQLLSNFDIHAAAGPATANVQSFAVDVTDGNLDIDLTTVVDNAKMSALEVVYLSPSCSGGGDDPIAGLSLSSNSPVTVGNASQFDATISGGTNVSYSWDFGDGTVRAGLASESHTYASAGSYLVTVTASNSVSSEGATTTMVVAAVPDEPVTGLTLSSNTPVNLGSASQFTAAIGGGTNVSYSWDFGDGTTTAGGPTIGHTYAATGSYLVTVTASNSVSSEDATTTMVVAAVPDVPISGLTLSSNSPVFLGSASQFTAAIGGGTNVSYSWDFGDGITTAGGPTIGHTYAATGSYLVTVTASNSVSSDSATTTMVVQAPPSFQALINVGGPAYTDGASRLWAADNSFAGGSTYTAGIAIANTTDDTLYQSERYGNFSYAIPVPAAGCYAVTLHFAEIWFGVFGGGGDGSRVFDVTIEGQTVLADYDIHVAVGPAAAVNESFPVTVSDGSLNISTLGVVENAKLSAIEVVANGPGCTGGDQPISGLTLGSNSPVLLGQAAQFSTSLAAGTNVSYSWDFGDGTVRAGGANESHSYAAAGSYLVTVTASNSVGSSSAQTTVQVNLPPDDPITGLALAGNSPVELGAVSIFTSSLTSGTNVSYSWDFGDGTVRAGSAGESHTYAAAGNYLVTVTASNNSGSASATATMVVNEPPPVDDPITGLSLSDNGPVTLGQVSLFTSNLSGGTNVSYDWDFGDGTVRAGGASESHTYAATGSYLVTVTASNSVSNGSATSTMVVEPAPDEPITGLSLSSNTPVELGQAASLAATVSGGTNISYSWDFGDGTVRAGGANESHSYAAAGSYLVTVTASNNVGSDQATTTVVVTDPPPPDDPITGLAVAGTTPVAVGATATFTASVTGGTNISYSWDFGDGTSASGGPVMNHSYGTAGSYTVTVTASNNAGTAQATLGVQVVAPISGLALNANTPVTLGSPMQFNASVATGTDVSYSWDYGDGVTFTGGPVQAYLYAAAGSYNVSVTASNAVSSATANIVVVVNDVPPFQLLINAGGSSFLDSLGRTWVADRDFTSGSLYSAGIAIDNTIDDTLYQTERYGNFSYDIAVPAAGCYAVDLHFAEIWWGVFGGGGDGSRLFNVQFEGQPLLTNFDIHATAGPMAATVQSFTVQVNDGSLDLDFVTLVDNAKISALAVELTGASCN